MIKVGFAFWIVATMILGVTMLMGWILGYSSRPTPVVDEKKRNNELDELLMHIRANASQEADDPLETHRVIDFEEYRRMKDAWDSEPSGWTLVYSEDLGRYVRVPRSPYPGSDQ